MRGLERCQEVGPQLCRLVPRERTAFQARSQRLALHVVHHVVEEAVGFAGAVHRDDVGVAEAREDAGLAEESLGRPRGGELRTQDLDGDLPLQRRVPGEKDAAHPAGSEFSLDLVLPRQRLAQPFKERLRHGWQVGAHATRLVRHLTGCGPPRQ